MTRRSLSAGRLPALYLIAVSLSAFSAHAASVRSKRTAINVSLQDFIRGGTVRRGREFVNKI